MSYNNTAHIKVNLIFWANSPFTQVSAEAKEVYFELRRYSDGYYKPSYPSQKTLASSLNKSEKSIGRHISELVKAGVISISKTKYGSNQYHFSLESSIAGSPVESTSPTSQICPPHQSDLSYPTPQICLTN